MKKYIQLALMAVMVFAATASVSAQKIGYVNVAEILASLPQMKAAESNLEGLQKQLQKKGQQMVASYQEEVQKVQALAAQGGLSPKQEEEEGAKFQARQEEIAKFEQQMMEDLQKKRAELLEPIYKEVNEVIEAVAKEKGYDYILDQQTLLYGIEAANVSKDVKARLGVSGN
ncbi:OmpH family outer membrane protein [Lewinella sp. 4G2]|uniref:OmpH family outer membrane protein n=1 Tax=Lewinella sp. 4G2 TaxID=1803372 RepID=UPI0007B4E6EC|nr:OmpH family outer membrane protein [Lewinella sp. 4G2]OAV43225.1 outer membrane chaperone Skp [Lewinella sp. 4G2]